MRNIQQKSDPLVEIKTKTRNPQIRIRMSKDFHTLKVKKVNRETADAVSVAFDIPEELQSAFKYKQGQYLTLRFDLKGQDVRRAYSMCSSPLDDELMITVKKVGTMAMWACSEVSFSKSVSTFIVFGTNKISRR